MAKILAISDSPTIKTGYGRVMQEILPAFHQAGHEVKAIGWGYQGEPHTFPFEVIPCVIHRDGHGEDIAAQVIRDWKPDILFTLGDPWMFSYVPELDERSAVTWLSYFPIDGYPIPPEWHNWIRSADIPIVFSQFAQNLVSDVLGKLPLFIPHGVDTNTFVPMDKKQVKEEIIGRSDVFVVGCVARNQPRKNLPALMKAFAEFSKKKDDVVLYLHAQLQDVGWNIPELVDRFDLHGKAYATTDFDAMTGVPDSELVKVYNLFDIKVLPSMAEGFGLPIMESQSCGVPVLVTDFSACTELVVNRQQLLKVKDTLIMGRNIEQAIVDTEDIVRKLNYFYTDWKKKDEKELSKLGQLGREKAKKMDWSIQNQRFVDLIKRIEPQVVKREKRIYPNFYRI